MEALAILEKKIADLVERVNNLRAENSALVEQNSALQKKIERLETLSLTQTKEDEHERELTKVMVDNLIRDIDAVVGQEHEQ